MLSEHIRCTKRIFLNLGSCVLLSLYISRVLYVFLSSSPLNLHFFFCCYPPESVVISFRTLTFTMSLTLVKPFRFNFNFESSKISSLLYLFILIRISFYRHSFSHSIYYYLSYFLPSSLSLAHFIHYYMVYSLSSSLFLSLLSSDYRYQLPSCFQVAYHAWLLRCNIKTILTM